MNTAVCNRNDKDMFNKSNCETTVSLATYNNQIHRQITQNTLKLIERRK